MKGVTTQMSSFKQKYNHGFSLLEVMIAMVIFAVGVLGLAGMQAIALENSFESSSRNQAIILAYSMSDRMLANRPALDNYLIAHADTVGVDTTCNTGTCTPAELASFDHSQWKINLSEQLVAGNGAIEVSGATPNYTVTVRWDEDRNGATGTDCPPIVATDLRCYQLQVRL